MLQFDYLTFLHINLACVCLCIYVNKRVGENEYTEPRWLMVGLKLLPFDLVEGIPTLYSKGFSIWPEEAGGISRSSTLCFLSTLIPGQSCSPHVEHSGLESRSGKKLTDLCLRATSFSEPAPQGEKAKPA